MKMRIRMAALFGLAIGSAVWAGGSKSPDTNTATGASASSPQGAISTQGAQAGTEGGTAQNGTSAPMPDAKGTALNRKQARAARHADIDKARQKGLDSVRAAFAGREAAEVTGSSEEVNEKLKEKPAK